MSGADTGAARIPTRYRIALATKGALLLLLDVIFGGLVVWAGRSAYSAMVALASRSVPNPQDLGLALRLTRVAVGSPVLESAPEPPAP